jgi:hypothetical protein
MRRITSSLVGLLSLLLVSAPVSAWVCDVSCSSRQARSDCHPSSITSKNDTAGSMPPSMDMGFDDSKGPMGPRIIMSATPRRSMTMFPQLAIVTQRFEQATKPALEPGATHDHSKSMSSCTHGACSLGRTGVVNIPTHALLARKRFPHSRIRSA